jgi:predicted transcriptional regulator
MSPATEGRQELKELLKRLRAERPAIVEAATARSSARRTARKAIKAELDKGPATVPALATACSLPSADVLWHVAAMRKYGQLVEDGQDGDYCLYRLKPDDEGSD